MLVTHSVLASIVLIVGASSSAAKPEAAETSARVLEGVRWVGPAMTLEGLRGKTVVLLTYATWCPICNKWSGELCAQLKESILDKPVVLLAVNNDEKPGNVRPYLEARKFFAPNIIHGYDASIAKRNGLPDLWGYIIIDPQGKIVEKGHAGSFVGGDANKAFVLAKKLRDQTRLGEFTVIDAKMPDSVKYALWPMELGVAAAGDLHKFSGEQKKQIDAALATYGAKELKNIRKLAKGDMDSQFAAYDRANALGLQLKGSSGALEARKVILALEAESKFKRELSAKKAYERCEKLPANSGRATALKVLVQRFGGTLYADKAKEVVAPAGDTAKAGN